MPKPTDIPEPASNTSPRDHAQHSDQPAAAELKKTKRETVKRAKHALNPQPRWRALKAEQKVQLDNGRLIEVGGVDTKLGERLVWCREGRRFVLTHFADWHGGSGDASAKLRACGLILVGGPGEVRVAVDMLKRFPVHVVARRSGWCKSGFALPSGTVLVAAGQPEPLKDFDPVGGILDRSGSLKGWKEEVAAPLADHLLASFFMMVMFAAALLRFTDRSDNFGFELAGRAGLGKSTLQALMASAAGPSVGADGTTYWRSLNSTLNALEEVMTVFNDMPLILDEAGLVPGGGKADARADAMREFAFRMAGGREKQRYGEPEGRRFRTIATLSTNQALADVLGKKYGAENHAIADRLITLPLDGRPHGIFDVCPPSHASTGAFADALKQAASEHYGHALPAYLSSLVEEVDRRPKRVRRRLAEDIASFLAKAQVNGNNGSEKRVGEAFGLIYAAVSTGAGS